MNLTEEWLLKNGIDQATLDKAKAVGSVQQPMGLVEAEFDVTFEPVIRVAGTTWIPISGWRPASNNEMAKGVKTKVRLKKRDRAIVCESARLAELPGATGKRRLSILIRVPPNQRRWDEDAFWKSTQDACVHADLLIDDGPLYYTMGTMRYAPDRGPLRTTLIVEDLDGV